MLCALCGLHIAQFPIASEIDANRSIQRDEKMLKTKLAFENALDLSKFEHMFFTLRSCLDKPIFNLFLIAIQYDLLETERRKSRIERKNSYKKKGRMKTFLFII